jgi:hypothetical protein
VGDKKVTKREGKINKKLKGTREETGLGYRA